MNRCGFLVGAAGTLAVAVSGCALVPPIPRRPDPEAADALGWIAHRDGAYALLLPRAEMGQNVATALKQVACAELGADWEAVRVELQDTARMTLVRATVGSESIRDYAVPLARACATLRDALAAGRTNGVLEAEERPIADLRAFASDAALRRPVGTAPPLEYGADIVTGRPLFAGDVRLEGMLYGRVLRAAASLDHDSAPRRWNADAGRAVPGLVDIVDDSRLTLARSRGLGLLAATPAALDRAEAALAVEWAIDTPAPGSTLEEALDIDARLAAGRLAHAVRDDAVDEAGPWDVDLRIDLPFAAHGAIEPRVAVARPADGGLEVWTGSQDVFYVRDVLARDTGLGRDAIRVRACRIGGGFGARTLCTVEREATILALAAGRPVKVQWTRPQELAQGFHRPPVRHRIRARLAGDRLAGWRHGFVSSHILFTGAVLPPWLQRVTDLVAGDGGVARGALPPYRIDRARIDYDLVRLPVHTGPWRGLGAGPNGLAVDSAIDEAAHAGGADPLAFRLAHADDPRLAGVLRRVAAMAGWPAVPDAAPGLRIGRGVGCGIYKETGYAAVVAEVAVDAAGRVEVTRLWCAPDCGVVVNPDQVRAQCEGNIAWGIGMVLGDRLPVRDGVVAALGFADAPIPVQADVPAMAIELVPSEAPPGGAGETAIVAAPAAVANAIRAATGLRPQRFPVDPAVLGIG